MASARALAPVQDFRVPGMAKVVSKAWSVPRLNANSNQATVPAARTVLAKLLGPEIRLGDSVLPLWTDLANSIYYVNLTVGEKDEDIKFPLLLDTGSGISWIMNDSCSSLACGNSAKFQQTVVPKSLFYLSYSGSPVLGQMVDTAENDLEFNIGGSLKLTNYSFGVALTAPSFFESFNLSGILGVQATYDDKEKSNMIHQLYYAGDIDKMEFAVLLNGISNVSHSLGGVFITGSDATNYASKLASSEIQYCDVLQNDQLFWMLNISSVHSGENHAINSSRGAIIDTGTTGMALSRDDADALHKAAFGLDYVGDEEGNFAFRCNATGNLSFAIDGHTFDLPVAHIRALEYDVPILQGYCASKIQGKPNLNTWILGASFLGNFYTIFDLEKSRVGFAPRVESFQITSPDSTASQSSSSATLSATKSSSSASSSTASSSTSSSGARSSNNTSQPEQHNLASSLSHISCLVVLAFSILLLS